MERKSLHEKTVYDCVVDFSMIIVSRFYQGGVFLEGDSILNKGGQANDKFIDTGLC